MNKYKYQLHTHTSPCSACGQLTPADLAKALYDYGYQGCVITNHFYHGNSGIDRGLSWHDFVFAYEKDYIECSEAAKKYDLDIIFGIEEVVVPGLEILCYGITPKILYDNPILQSCDIATWTKIMRENGVVLIQAHPFRKAFYIPNPGPLPPEYCDGVEVYNHGNAQEENDQAQTYANEYTHFIKTSSGDAHWRERVPCGGIVTENRIKDSFELVKILKEGAFELIIPEKTE